MPYRRAPSNYQLAKRIRKIESEIELKHKDEDFFVGQVDADFSVYDICVVGLGGDSRGRIGDEIQTTSLKMRLGIIWTPNTYNNLTAHLRMILFWDSAPNGDVPSIVSTGPLDQSVLDPASTSLEPIFDQYNYNTTQDRFRIIYDKVWTLRSQFITSDPDTLTDLPGPVSMFVTKKWKLGRKQVFQGNAADYTSMVTNGIYVGWYLYSPDNSTSEFNSLKLDAAFRLYFKDA